MKYTKQKSFLSLLGFLRLPICFCVLFFSYFSQGQIYIVEGTQIYISESTKLYIDNSEVSTSVENHKTNSIVYIKKEIADTENEISENISIAKSKNIKAKKRKSSLKALADAKKVNKIPDDYSKNYNQISTKNNTFSISSNHKHFGILSTLDNSLLKHSCAEVSYNDFHVFALSKLNKIIYHFNCLSFYNLYNKNVSRGPPFYL